MSSDRLSCVHRAEFFGMSCAHYEFLAIAKAGKNSPLKQYTCKVCGNLVSNVVTHDDWHDKVDPPSLQKPEPQIVDVPMSENMHPLYCRACGCHIAEIGQKTHLERCKI